MLHPQALRKARGAFRLKGLSETKPAVPISDGQPVGPQVRRPFWGEEADVGAGELAGNVSVDLSPTLIAYASALSVRCAETLTTCRDGRRLRNTRRGGKYTGVPRARRVRDHRVRMSTQVREREGRSRSRIDRGGRA